VKTKAPEEFGATTWLLSPQPETASEVTRFALMTAAVTSHLPTGLDRLSGRRSPLGVIALLIPLGLAQSGEEDQILVLRTLWRKSGKG